MPRLQKQQKQQPKSAGKQQQEQPKSAGKQQQQQQAKTPGKEGEWRVARSGPVSRVVRGGGQRGVQVSRGAGRSS